MKILVGLACVAIVTFVGYFFWGEWQKADAPRQAELAMQRSCHLDAGEVKARMNVSLLFMKEHPELAERVNDCSDHYGAGWAETNDPALLAIQAEGAARMN